MEDKIDKEKLKAGGYKADESKARMDLIPPEVLLALGQLYAQGAAKYSPDNWKRGMNYSRLYAAMQRHANQFWAGEKFDKEGQHHLDSVIWCAVALRYYEMYPDEYATWDDRYTFLMEKIPTLDFKVNATVDPVDWADRMQDKLNDLEVKFVTNPAAQKEDDRKKAIGVKETTWGITAPQILQNVNQGWGPDGNHRLSVWAKEQQVEKLEALAGNSLVSSLARDLIIEVIEQRERVRKEREYKVTRAIHEKKQDAKNDRS